jgi:DNA-binding CsgD family transcriptional regulator
MMDFDTELLMLELASRVSKREMDVVRMKADGYGTREIARAQRMPMKGVNDLLAGLRDIVLAVCFE